MSDPPLPSDWKAKYQPTPDMACEPGAPVFDATHLLQTGEPCCSLCRRVVKVENERWVHA